MPEQSFFELWRELDNNDGIMERILDYLTFRSRSSLATAAFHYETVWHTIANRTVQELNQRRAKHPFIDNLCQHIAAEHETNAENKGQRLATAVRVRKLSEQLAILDYTNLIHSENHPPSLWPIWMGKISIRTPTDRETIRIVVSSETFSIPGSSLMFRHRIPTGTFRPVPMNLVPLPPFGSIRGLTASDNDRLRVLTTGLGNQILVPYFYQQDDPLDIRILSREEALNRLNQLPPSFARYSDRVPDQPLVCFWYTDEQDVPRPLDIIIAMLRVKDRLLLSMS